MTDKNTDRTTLPIENGFPIERINEIAEKEGRAGQHYRPIYTMHKWWARRLGCVFRSISLYTLLDDPENVSVAEPGNGQEQTTFGDENSEIQDMIDSVDLENPESLWPLYNKDVTIDDKKVLDPFMGGGTSLGESSRFGAEVLGNDLNPVAWFVCKKEMEAGRTDVEELEQAFDKVEEDVADEITQWYETECPTCSGTADVMYYLWTKQLDCTNPNCDHTVSLFNDYRVGKGRYEHKGKYSVFCPGCENITLVDDWRSESECEHCNHEFTPENGTASGSEYTCRECGDKNSITDAVAAQDGYNRKLYAVEYFCKNCDDHESRSRSDAKGYKPATDADRGLFADAKAEWDARDDLNEYVPHQNIRNGAKTAASSVDGSDVFQHGIEEWADMFNDRQLLCLSNLLKAIGQVENQNVKEYLLLAFSDALRTNGQMTTYDTGSNGIDHIFKTNSFDPPVKPCEGNVWGARYGRGTFQSIWSMVKKGVEYADSPTERTIDNGDTTESNKFETSIGENVTIQRGDARNITQEDEFDAVITDPPYYDNIIYSELSDYFYVWQKILLKEEYEHFEAPHTSRAESIVANPVEDKGKEEFEDEIRQALDTAHTALKDDGVLTFTYHHSSAESWGELLEALCDVGFEITATYPITADIQKLKDGESVSFDIIVVARPAGEREPIAWNKLRRRIDRKAKEMEARLKGERDLSAGDIGVIEMGECFHEYSKHHGKVHGEAGLLTAKDVVQRIYGIIQDADDYGTADVFMDLLEEVNQQEDSLTFSDVNKRCRGTQADVDDLKSSELIHIDGGEVTLGTWDHPKRITYIREHLDDDDLSSLAKAQYLRWCWAENKPIKNPLNEWGGLDTETRNRLEDLGEIYVKTTDYPEIDDSGNDSVSGKRGREPYYQLASGNHSLSKLSSNQSHDLTDYTDN